MGISPIFRWHVVVKHCWEFDSSDRKERVNEADKLKRRQFLFDHVRYAMQDQEMTYKPCSDSLGSKPTDMLISAQHDVMVSHKL